MSNQISSISTNPAPLSWVESLFSRMQGMYGSKFLDMWRDTDITSVKSLWAEEMGKLTRDQLNRGVEALRTQDWPPSLPQFIKLCAPSVDPLVAYYEAVAGIQARANGEMGVWSHPAIYCAAMPMSFDLKNQTYSQIKPRWERALSEQMDRGEWDEIKMPLVALPDASRLSREEAAKRLQEVGAASATKDAESRTDHLRWAKIALEDLKHGGKRFPTITYKLAKEALEA